MYTLQRACSRMQSSHQNTQENKMNSLVKQELTTNFSNKKMAMNLSTRNLTKVEESLLSKCFNCIVALKRVPLMKIISLVQIGMYNDKSQVLEELHWNVRTEIYRSPNLRTTINKSEKQVMIIF